MTETEGAGNSRPLPVLRALIDVVDREVLGLLARRMAVVGEVAAYKREHQVRVRDLVRERQVLEDRGMRARALGLPAELVQSMFRLILVASRQHQAKLRAELPVKFAPKAVTVVGGRGGMGAMVANLFGDLGHAVMTADMGTELTPVEAAKLADVVVIAVPIDATEAVIAEVGPHVRPDALLMDVTSIKTAPLEAMMRATRASVIGTHPMFGPGVHTLQGQRIVVCHGRGDDWLAWLTKMLSAMGLVITESTAEEHDRAMAVVQVLNHFHTQVLGLALQRLGTPMEQTLAFTSPAYLLEAYVTGRHFAQSPELYGAIEMRNPRAKEVIDVFQRAAAELAAVIEAKDQRAFSILFREVHDYFGPFTEEALEQSRHLVDRVVELTAGRPPNPRAVPGPASR